MKKILLVGLCLVSLMAAGQCPKVPQYVGSYYNYWGLKDSVLLQLPRKAPLITCRDSGMTYYNTGDSALHWWTGFTDRTFLQDANNGLFDNNNVAQLGEPLNQSGNPAKLLHLSEIPFNAFALYMYDTLNTSVTKSSVRIWDTLYTTAQTVPEKIVQNKSAGFFQAWQPYNYGVSYTSPYRPGTGIMKAGMATSGYVSAVSLDAMPDNVYEIWGYNSDPTAGRHDTSDAAIRLACETNYLNTLDATVLNFEVHLPEVTCFDGTIVRTNSYYISKNNGYCKNLQSIDDIELNSVTNNATYAQIAGLNQGGAINLFGSTNGVNQDGTFKMINLVDGSFSEIQSLQGNLFIGNSGNSNANIANITMFPDNNLWLGRSSSLNPNTWQGVLIGTDSTGHNKADASSVLECQSVQRGLLPPRMTTIQKLAIASPAEGLIVYDLTLHKLCLYTGSTWETITSL